MQPLTPAQQDLVRRHTPLAVSLALRVWRTWPDARRLGEYGDVEQEALVALSRAVAGFDPTRGYRFSTYGHRVIENHFCGLIISRRARYRPPAPLDGVPHPTALDPAPDDHDELRAAVAALPALDRQLLTLRFGLDGGAPQTLAQLGRRRGRSERGAWYAVRRALARLEQQLGGQANRAAYV